MCLNMCVHVHLTQMYKADAYVYIIYIYIHIYLFIYTRFLCRCKCTFEHTRRRLVGHPARPSPAFSIGTTLGFVPWRMWHNTTGRSLSQCCLPKLEMARKREREREKKKGLNLMKFGLIWKILEGCMVPLDLWKHQLFNHGLIRQVAVP